MFYTLFAVTSFCLIVVAVDGKEIIPVSMGHEIGGGIGKIAFHLNSLINECEPENLSEWFTFLEEFLECKENAGTKKTYDERVAMTALETVEEHCNTWPRLHKCYKGLANVLNVCYEKQNGMKKKGTDALSFADTYSDYICNNKHQYLVHTHNTESDIPIKSRPMKCYLERKNMITECTTKKFKAETSTNFCRNLGIVRECFDISYEDCENMETRGYVTELLKQISKDLQCAAD